MNRHYLFKKALLIGVLGIIVGCTANRDQLLNFFFDGVNPPVEEIVAGKPGRAGTSSSPALIMPKVVHEPYGMNNCGDCHDPTRFNTDILVEEMPDLCMGCHDQYDWFDKENIHSPAEDGECAECHHPHQSKYQKLLHRPLIPTCMGCHDVDFDEEDYGGLKHKPLIDDENACITCHNPHASDEEFLVNMPIPELCFECHGDLFLNDDKELKHENVHSPFEDGECSECHHPHQSSEEKLLQYPLDEICFTCHAVDFMDDNGVFDEENVHSPVEDGECNECHNPHQSSEEALLRKPVDEICFTCHAVDFQDDNGVFDEENVHSPVEDGECIECHDPHQSGEETLLRLPKDEVCFSCHAEDFMDEEGEFEYEVVHSPVEDGECYECHDPHQSSNEFLLKSANVNLCFECHVSDDLDDEKGIHKNQMGDLEALADGPKEIGTCIKCHDPHLSDQEFLLIDEWND